MHRFADIRWHAEVDSTNRVAADLVRAGAPDGVVVVADHQTAGRGRRGRTWEAPPGSSLLVSVLLRPAPALVTLAAGLAAAGACEAVAGVAIGLKWPNDLLVGVTGPGGRSREEAGPGGRSRAEAGPGGRSRMEAGPGGRFRKEAKVGGILTEAVAGAAVVGLGVNLAWAPAGAARLGPDIDRRALLDAYLSGLDAPGDVLTRYRARCTTLGRRVLVELPNGTMEGVATDVDDVGRLVVDGRPIAAGDVVHLSVPDI